MAKTFYFEIEEVYSRTIAVEIDDDSTLQDSDLYEIVENEYLSGDHEPLTLNTSDYTGQFTMENILFPNKETVDQAKSLLTIAGDSVEEVEPLSSSEKRRLQNEQKYLFGGFGSIVKMENRENPHQVRYFMVGSLYEEKFTGVVYDYLGGGAYQEVYIIDGVVNPDLEEDDWRQQARFFNQGTLLKNIDEFMTEDLTHVNGEYFSPKIKATEFKGLILEPIEIGNTIWEKDND